ncbi:MAG: hypothetical protein ACXIUB_02920 [Wenzhouxiangella sp.]
MSRQSALIVRVADLEDLIDSAGPQRPAWLERFLRQGTTCRLDPAAGGTDLAFDQALPVAPLTCRLDGLADELVDGAAGSGYWMRADPIGLRADIRAVWVLPGQAVDPLAIEPALQALFAESGLAFKLPHPQRGYLALAGKPDCRFQPPTQTAGRSLDEFLPEGPEARFWRRLGNEVQMVLHQEAGQGDAGFQGLWFWGAGSLADHAEASARIDWLASDDCVLRAAADWKAIHCLDPHSLNLADCPVGRGLVDWTTRTVDSAAANVQRLGYFLRPALRRLRWGRLTSLTLAGRSTAFTLQPARLWWPVRP